MHFRIHNSGIMKNKNSKMKVFHIIIVLLFVVFLLVHFIPQRESLNEKYDRIVKEATTEFEKQNQTAFDKFSDDISKAEIEINKRLDAAKNNIPEIVEDFKGFAFCGKLVYKQAKDAISKSEDTQEAIDEVLYDRYTKYLVEANAIADALLEGLNHSLESNLNNYQANVLDDFQKVNNSYTNDESKVIIIDTLLDVNKISSEISSKVTGIVIGVIIDAITIKSTMAVIKKVCAAVVAKVCSSVSFATISSVSDGPLPWGEIVGGVVVVGTTIWSAYDIYQITKVLPQEMETSLNQGVETLRESLISNVKKQAEESLNLYTEAGDQFNQQLNAKINGIK